MAAHKLPISDQGERETVQIDPPKARKVFKDEEAIASVGDPKKLFKCERVGWKGNVNLECYWVIFFFCC